METIVVAEFQFRRGTRGAILWLNNKRSIELTIPELRALCGEFDKQQILVLGEKSFPAEMTVVCQYQNGLVMLKMRRQVASELSYQLTIRARGQ
jgi:hypothetical protein